MASPICPLTGTWSEDLAFAGSPEHSDNAQLHWSRNSGELFQKSRCFGLWVAVRTRLWRFRPWLNSEAWRLEPNTATHRCLSCRCKRGDSCRGRRSSVRHRATPSPRSLHLTENSCPAGPCTSSHTAACTEERNNSQTTTKIKIGKHSALLDYCESPTFYDFNIFPRIVDIMVKWIW